MTIRYKQLVQDLAEARKGLVGIIDNIEAGDDGAVDRLDEFVFDGKRVFNDNNKELFVLNTRGLKGIRRFNGNPFMIHPAGAAWLFAYLAHNSKRIGKETAEARDQIIGYILTHDFLEEALEYDEGKFSEAMKSWGEHHHKALKASVLMSLDRNWPLFERIVIVYQVKTYGSSALAYATITEKLDNTLDLEYMKKRRVEFEEIKKAWWISHPLFVVSELRDKIPGMYWPTIKICIGILKDNSKVGYWRTYERLRRYRKEFDENREKVIESSEKHLARYGVCEKNK